MDIPVIYKIALILLNICILVAGMLVNKNREKKIRAVTNSNSKHPWKLFSCYGIGMKMLGNFRYRNEVSIMYYCFSFFSFPILPIGCYMCKSVDSSSYRIPGTQPWRIDEIIQLYSRWLWVVLIVLIIDALP